MCESCTTAASAVVLQQKDFIMTFFFFLRVLKIYFMFNEHSSYGVFVSFFVLKVNGRVAFFASA